MMYTFFPLLLSISITRQLHGHTGCRVPLGLKRIPRETEPQGDTTAFKSAIVNALTVSTPPGRPRDNWKMEDGRHARQTAA